jgi:hypothetical protein
MIHFSPLWFFGMDGINELDTAGRHHFHVESNMKRNRAYFSNGGSDLCRRLRSTLLCPLSGIAERIMMIKEIMNRG